MAVSVLIRKPSVAVSVRCEDGHAEGSSKERDWEFVVLDLISSRKTGSSKERDWEFRVLDLISSRKTGRNGLVPGASDLN